MLGNAGGRRHAAADLRPCRETRSNSAVLQLSRDGLGLYTLAPAVTGGGTVQVIVDVSGYFQ